MLLMTDKEKLLVAKGDNWKVVVRDPACPNRYFRFSENAFRFAGWRDGKWHPNVVAVFQAVNGEWVEVKRPQRR